ncbi:adp-ribose pyrophosphatase [Streptococcus dysgalactiae]|nr:adp-ribose pyrophosphatase [Streptococcus dysgalactiae]
MPDGKTAGRELIFHKGAVAVLAVTPEGKIIIVKQYRKAIEAVSYEFLQANWKSVKLAMRWLQQRVNLKRRLNTRVIWN